MKKRVIIIVSIIAIIFASAGITWISVNTYQKMTYNTQIVNEKYIYNLCIHGEFSYKPNKVIVHEMWVEEQSLTFEVVLYNAFHVGEEITMEQLLQEYDDFCNKGIRGENIEKFINFHHGAGIGIADVYYKKYIGETGSYLKENFSTNFENATVEQIQEAAEYAVELLYEKMENR